VVFQPLLLVHREDDPRWGQGTDSATISSPELDSLVKEARLARFAGTKLTGTSRGGYMIGWPGTGLGEGAVEGFRSKHPNSLISYIPSEGVTTWETPS
jgi:mevalonate kinase